MRGALFPTANTKGTVVVAPGRAEFIEKYFEVVSDLNARSFSAAVIDWRGQGLSHRDPRVKDAFGHIGDFADFRSDLCSFIDVVKNKLAPPFILLTHSMGGTPALQMLADGEDTFRAAVLSAPMTRLYDSAAERFAVRTVAAAASAIGLDAAPVAGVKEHSMSFEGNVLTSDPARHARFRDLQTAAPNAVVHAPTYGWVKAAMAAMDDLHRPDRFANLKTPVLIVSAGDDQLVRSSDHEWLARQSPLIERIVIEDALHELLMERDEFRARFWSAFDAFVSTHVGVRATQMTQA